LGRGKLAYQSIQVKKPGAKGVESHQENSQKKPPDFRGFNNLLL
jgi:hypothetical protein